MEQAKEIIARMPPQMKLRGYSSSESGRSENETPRVRGTYNLPQEVIEMHREEIIQIEDERDRCAGCAGTCYKTGSAQGMIPVVTDDYGRFGVSYTVCDVERRRREKVRLDRLFQSAHVPKRYRNLGFADYRVTQRNKEAVRAARWMVTAESGGLLLHGGRGAGKTMLAAIIANERAKSGKNVLFVSAIDLLADIKATFGKGTTQEVTQAIRTAPMLVLDDLGTERMSSWVGEQLFGIFNYRYNEDLPTIVTSNFAPEQLSKHLSEIDPKKREKDIMGERIVSRICGMCEPIQMESLDWRMKGAC